MVSLFETLLVRMRDCASSRIHSYQDQKTWAKIMVEIYCSKWLAEEIRAKWVFVAICVTGQTPKTGIH